MAAALVGGSFLSAFLQVLFDRLASPKIINFFKQQKLNHGSLRKLGITVTCVCGFLGDAEDKQIMNPRVRWWLDELTDAIYEADDLLDQIAYEAQRLEFGGSSYFQNHEESNLISSVNSKLEEILERLEYLVQLKDALNLKQVIVDNPSSRKIPTTCLVDESAVFGRNAEIEAIVEMVLSNESELGVIPIVGMPGIGKTTLAQVAYNDSEVQERFHIKGWVYVSEEFNVSKITRDVLQEFGKRSEASSTLNQLQLELQQRVKENRLFLVFDDVWNEKPTDWEKLLTPLKFAAKGSKIVVTTRHERVASVVGTLQSCHLKELATDDSWRLFKRYAFDVGSENSTMYTQLEDISRTIVEMCKGLPLALKTIGSVLRCRKNPSEWNQVLESKVWSSSELDILPSLILSYLYLPSHLKQCFAYCSLFPKGYPFEKERIILQWMAHGFLAQPKMEVGRAYFDDLVSRSFFQVYQSYFVMHDLFNDLAKFVSCKFCFLIEGDEPYNMDEKTRHISFENGKAAFEKLDGICKARFLRTFMFSRPSYLSEVVPMPEERVFEALLKTLEYSRVLIFPGFAGAKVLPNVICDLKHLRYLDLSFCLWLQKLPESFGNLYNLQTLFLYRCSSLVKLPTTFGRLINMVCLDIRHTMVQEMPPEMGKLKNLQILADFYVLGENGGSQIKELGKLQHIEGRLEIRNLENVNNCQDAMEANLKGKNQLQELSLMWEGDCDDTIRDKAVLEQLQPQERIEKLAIRGYGGTTFPSWVGDSIFSNMLELKLYQCNYCFQLPPLGQLASLKRLEICKFNGVVAVGSEFYGSNPSPFRSLEYLEFKEMEQWCEWSFDVDKDESGAFPLLQELCIFDSPSLTILALPNHLPSLKRVLVSGCPKFQAVPIFQKESAYGFPDICISDSVTSHPRSGLELVGSSASEVIRGDLASLCSLYFRNFPNQISFLNGGFRAPNLKHLHLENCSHLKSLPESMQSSLPSLVEININNCPELECVAGEELPCGLESLVIESCNKLVSSCRYWERQSIRFFHICISEDLEYFPEEIVLPFNVTSIFIDNLQKLVYFDGKGIQYLKSLQCLRISHCPNLVSFPVEGLHSKNLIILEVYGCPNLRSFPEGGLPSGLGLLSVLHCDKLISNRMQWDLQKLSFLIDLTVGGYEKMESFPEEKLLPSTLTSLKIDHLQNLRSLNGKELQQLTSLKTFEIRSCPKLESIPLDEIPSSLSKLYISGCPKLPRMPE